MEYFPTAPPRYLVEVPHLSRHARSNIVRFYHSTHEWKDARYNDKLVFQAIDRRCRHGLSIAKAIRNLFISDDWAPRMHGKTAESWKRKYLQHRKSVTIRKQKKCEITPENTGSNDTATGFIRTPCHPVHHRTRHGAAADNYERKQIMLNTLEDRKCGSLMMPMSLIMALEKKFMKEYEDEREQSRAISVLDRMGEYRARFEDVVDVFETTEFERRVALQIESIVEGYHLAGKLMTAPLKDRREQSRKEGQTSFAGKTKGENHD